jgi:hypothetical protein
MSRRAGRVGVFLFLVWGLSCPTARAQTPPALPFDPAPQLYPQPSYERIPFDAPAAAPPVEKTTCPWETSLLFGLPTGVRFQRVITPAAEHLLVGEVFLGLYAIIPMATGGLRWNCTTFHGGGDALIVAPGLDVGAFENPFYHAGGWFNSNIPGGGIVTLDVDFQWRHRFGEHFNGELGLKLGGAVIIAHGAAPLPVVSLYAGCEF